jgi:hypothetical protein
LPARPAAATKSNSDLVAAKNLFPTRQRLLPWRVLPPDSSLLPSSIFVFGGQKEFHGRPSFNRYCSYSQASSILLGGEKEHPTTNETMGHLEAGGLLNVLQYAYPLILLFFFLFAFTLRSIAISSATDSDEPAHTVYGPGGKPLPPRKAKKAALCDTTTEISRPRKLVFQWLSVFACCTWIGNAAAVIIHALYSRKDGWWCGQAAVVSASNLRYVTLHSG